MAAFERQGHLDGLTEDGVRITSGEGHAHTGALGYGLIHMALPCIRVPPLTGIKGDGRYHRFLMDQA